MDGTVIKKHDGFVEMINNMKIPASVVYYSKDATEGVAVLGKDNAEERASISRVFDRLYDSLSGKVDAESVKTISELLKLNKVNDETLKKIKIIERKIKKQLFFYERGYFVHSIGVINAEQLKKGLVNVCKEASDLCVEIEKTGENSNNTLKSLTYEGINDEIIKIIDVLNLAGFEVKYDAKSNTFVSIVEIDYSDKYPTEDFALLKGVLTYDNVSRFINGYLNPLMSSGDKTLSITADSLYETLLLMAKEKPKLKDKVAKFEGKKLSDVQEILRTTRVKKQLLEIEEFYRDRGINGPIPTSCVNNIIQQLQDAGIEDKSKIKDILVEIVKNKHSDSELKKVVELGIQTKLDSSFKFVSEVEHAEDSPADSDVKENEGASELGDSRYNDISGNLNSGIVTEEVLVEGTVTLGAEIIPLDVYITFDPEEGCPYDSLYTYGAYHQYYEEYKETPEEKIDEIIEEVKSKTENEFDDSFYTTLKEHIVSKNPDFKNEYLTNLQEGAIANAKVRQYLIDLNMQFNQLDDNLIDDIGSLEGDMDVEKAFKELEVEMKAAVETQMRPEAEEPSSLVEGINFKPGSIYRLGYFDDLYDIFSKKVEGLSGDARTSAVETHIQKYREQSKKTQSDAYNVFFDNLEKCVCDGNKDNKFYKALQQQAIEELKVKKAVEMYHNEMAENQKKIDEVLQIMTLDELDDDLKSIYVELENYKTLSKTGNTTQIEQLACDKYLSSVTIAPNDLKNAYSQQKTDKYIKLGDKKEFDVKGYQKKMKPFNAKAGIKYLEELEKAIKAIPIMQQGKDERAETLETATRVVKDEDKTPRKLAEEIAGCTDEAKRKINNNNNELKPEEAKKVYEDACILIASALEKQSILETKSSSDGYAEAMEKANKSIAEAGEVIRAFAIHWSFAPSEQLKQIEGMLTPVITPEASKVGEAVVASGSPMGPGAEVVGETTTIQNAQFSDEELREKVAWYMMGDKLFKDNDDYYRSIKWSDFKDGVPRTKEDMVKLNLRQRGDMIKRVFDLIAFGEDKEKIHKFENGKNTILCTEIGYLQQIVYKIATDPQYKVDKVALCNVLISNPTLGIKGQDAESDANFVQRVMNSNERINDIITIITSLDYYTAAGLLGLSSTRNPETNECSFGGKIDEKLLEDLRGKSNAEIKAILDDKFHPKKTVNFVNQSELDFAVAQDRARLRKYIAKEIITQLKSVTKFDSKDQVLFNVTILLNTRGRVWMDNAGMTPEEIEDMRNIIFKDIETMLNNGELSDIIKSNTPAVENHVEEETSEVTPEIKPAVVPVVEGERTPQTSNIEINTPVETSESATDDMEFTSYDKEILWETVKELRKFEWVVDSISHNSRMSEKLKSALTSNPKFIEKVKAECDKQPKIDYAMPFHSKEDDKIKEIISNLVNKGVSREEIVSETIKAIKNPNPNDEWAKSTSETFKTLMDNRVFDENRRSVFYYLTVEHIKKLEQEALNELSTKSKEDGMDAGM